jgi:DNA-binding response OmpR family regulator
MQSTLPVIPVLEDDPELAEVLCDLRQHAGYAVERAADGEAGVARSEVGKIDLVLLDLMLPDVA